MQHQSVVSQVELILIDAETSPLGDGGFEEDVLHDQAASRRSCVKKWNLDTPVE